MSYWCLTLFQKNLCLGTFDGDLGLLLPESFGLEGSLWGSQSVFYALICLSSEGFGLALIINKRKDGLLGW